MKAGSIIYDWAAIQGGNTAHTKGDKLRRRDNWKNVNKIKLWK